MKQFLPQSRRSILKSSLFVGGVAATGTAALGLMPKAAVGANAIPTNGMLIKDVFGMGVRKEAHSLTADSDDVRIYRDVVGWMKQRSDENPLDPMGWAQHWVHHSQFCATNTFQFQVHYGWYFLPWHRAYLFNLEQKIRRVANEPAFALPYWDWTRNRKIPSWYFGENNPLNNTTRMQGPDDAVPDDFIHPGPSMRAKQWAHFGGRPRIKGENQVEGTMEQSIHNCVHNWIGGEMASFDGAGNDTIFQSHHGQIDRFWEAWMRNQGGTTPEAEAYRDQHFWFYGWEGRPEPVRVGDLDDTEALGYTFDDLTFLPTLNDSNRPVYDGGGVEMGKIDPDSELLAQVRDVSAGAHTGRVTISYERMQLPMHPFHHRLFLIDQTDDEATYLGTQCILPIPDLNRGLEKEVSSQVEVPPEALATIKKGNPMQVVGVPVPLKGRDIPLQPVPFKGVSLTVEA